jgi:hypothetical protein
MVNFKRLLGLGSKPKPPALKDSLPEDTHETRQAAAEADVKDTQERIGSMSGIQTEADAMALVRTIYTTGKDLDGATATVEEGRTGETLDDLKRNAAIKSRSIVVGQEPPRVYAVAHTWEGMQIFVFKAGAEVEAWKYEEPKKITE